MNWIITALLLLFLPHLAMTEPLNITAVGDIMLAGSGEKAYKKYGYDYPFDLTREILKQGDLVIGNLESPITTSAEKLITKTFRFKADPKAAEAIKNAGFTHLSLANNHILDFGSRGLKDTIEILDSKAISHAGAGQDLFSARMSDVTSIRGIKIAFLAYSLTYPKEFFAGAERAGTAPGYASLFTADIEQAKKNADCVIVSFHWGGEGLDKPKPYQVKIAHKAIDAGADIVIGHHPHVLQGVEQYENGVIFYSLGNFTFGSMSRSSKRSMIARILFDGGVKEVEVIPLNVLNSEVGFQPKPLSGKPAERAVKAVDTMSAIMGSRIAAVNGRYLLQRNDDE